MKTFKKMIKWMLKKSKKTKLLKRISRKVFSTVPQVTR